MTWNCPAWVKLPFTTFMVSIPGTSAFLGSHKTNRILVERGYIQTKQGRRVQIIYQPAAQNEFTIGGIESFREAAARNNFTATTKVIRFAAEFVNESLAAQTGFPVGSEIYEVHRVRYLEGKLLILDINVFRRDIVPNLTAEIAA